MQVQHRLDVHINACSPISRNINVFLVTNCSHLSQKQREHAYIETLALVSLQISFWIKQDFRRGGMLLMKRFSSAAIIRRFLSRTLLDFGHHLTAIQIYRGSFQISVNSNIMHEMILLCVSRRMEAYWLLLYGHMPKRNPFSSQLLNQSGLISQVISLLGYTREKLLSRSIQEILYRYIYI